MKLIPLIQFLIVFAVCTSSSRVEASKPEKIIGLVEIPKVFGTTSPNGPPGQIPPQKIEPVGLFTEPKEGSTKVETIQSAEQLISKEHGYEEKSAVVYEQKQGWYKIATIKKKGWLTPAYAGKFHSIESLLMDGMAFLEPHWNGHLYSNPDQPQKFQKLEGISGESTDVEIVGKKRVKEVLWFHVKILPPGARCNGVNDLKPTHQGWIPAYSDSDELNIWYYSRGC